MVKWTKDQEKAITIKNKKVIVSAAAGSGKTAVLSERVIQYILDGGDVNRLLIVTFTKLAANEMKERIKENINKVLKNDPNNRHLRKQLLLIEDAKIVTMDAFYSSIVKENFYKLKIKPDFNVIEENDYKVLKYELARKIINEELDKNDNIIPLLDNFCDIKNGYAIEDILIKLNTYVDKMPFPESVLSNLENNYQQNNFNETIWSNLFYNEITDYFNNLKILYDEIIEEASLDDVLSDKLVPFINEEISTLNKIISFSENREYENIRHMINFLSFDRFPSIKGYSEEYIVIKAKKIRDNYKKTVKNYQETISKYSEIDFLQSLKKQANLINLLCEITLKFRRELKEIRLKQNFLGFDDIPHLVITLLIKDCDTNNKKFNVTDYAIEIANQFDEILIDEFQDTNYIQHIIFKALSKDEKNLFIVGDVKQSIYGFRSARSEILTNEKNDNKNNNNATVISLSQNFRSRLEIITFCNYLFSKIMSDTFGEVNYDDSEQLNLGATYEENQDCFVEMHILTDDDTDEDDLKNIEKEALFVAKRINELIENDYQVYDNKKQSFRKLKLSDIAILLRSVNPDANIFREKLVNAGIEVYTETSPIYFDNYEIKLIISILKTIVNPYDEVSLVATLRSPLFGFDDNEITQIKSFDYNNNMYQNLLKINSNKIKVFIDKLNLYQEYNKYHNIHELLNYIYNDTNILFVLSCLENGSSRNKNLILMLNHAHKYSLNKSYNLVKFINYLEGLTQYQLSLEGANPTNTKDSVLITTIHKSKGLEFPIVFLPHLEKKFNVKDLKEEFILDFDYLMGFKLRNYTNYTTDSSLNLELIKNYKLQKQISEELRILYVALTRPKEKLIMSAYVNNLETKFQNISSLIGNDNTINSVYLKTVNNYIDLILPIILKSKVGKSLRELFNIDTKLYNDEINLKLNIINDINYLDHNRFISNEESKSNISKVIENLNYNYCFNNKKIKEQITTTSVKAHHKVNLPNFINDNVGFKVGTTYHKMMEYIPFINYQNYIQFEEEIKKLQNKKIITQDELNMLDLSKIYTFFNSELYIDTILNSKVYHEYEIYFNTSLKDIDSNNEEVLVDGTVDLLCLTDNKAIIIDYKSDIVNNEKELIDRYKKQLDLYETGIKSIYQLKTEKYLYSFNLKKFIKL